MRWTDTKPVFRFRADRFFSVSGLWFFSTREKKDFGPFGSREQAETSLSRYLDTQSIVRYLRGSDPTMSPGEESAEHLVARLSEALV